MSSFAASPARAPSVAVRVLFATLSLLPGLAQGGVFKCIIDGQVSYQSEPCKSGVATYKEVAPQQAQGAPAGVIMVQPVMAVAVGGHAAAIGAMGSAMPAPGSPGSPGAALGAAKPAIMLPHDPKLTGIDAYAEGRSDLTAEQKKIGYAFSIYDRAAALPLVQAARDSLDFAIWRTNPYTPLIIATQHADIEMIAAILAKGVPVDRASAVYPSGQTALFTAVGAAYSSHYAQGMPPPERFLETAKYLLKAGANPNAKDSLGGTPLGTALRLKVPGADGESVKMAMIETLLEKGAKPGPELPSDNATPDADAAMIGLLLTHGFDASAGLASAVQSKRPDLVKLLLAKGADPNARAVSGPPHRILADADMPIAKLLLAAGANPNVCTGEDASGKCTGEPLLIGAFHRDPEMFRLLIAKGANPNVQDGYGGTLLSETITHRSMREQGIRKICVAGTTNCRDVPEDTFDRMKVAKMLLDAGADPNQASREGAPLMLVEENDHAMLGLLLDRGARPQVMVVEGEKIGPIAQAIAARHDYLAGELLRRTPGKLGSEERWGLFTTTIDGRLDLAQELVRRGISANARLPFGETPLHYAVGSMDTAAAIKRLIALGADPNAQTDAIPEALLGNPNSSAASAQVQAKFKVYSALRMGPISFGGYADGKLTPLMLAVVSHRTEAVRALLAGGAKVSIKSQRGFTALDLASKMQSSDLVQLLSGRP